MILQRYRTPFVGRTDELSRLERGLSVAADGSPVVVLVGGEAGVGKTRLVQEFARRAQGRRALVLAGGCVDVSGGGLPYGPVVEALREFRQEHGEDALLGSEVVDIPWLLPPGGGTGPGPVLDPADGMGQLRLFEWMLRFVRRLGADAPVVLLVEDLHWASSSTLDLLKFLVHNARTERFMLVVTCRDDEYLPVPVRGFLAGLGRGRSERIELGRFGRHELTTILAGVLGYQPEADLADRIHAKSEGNAFFAEELAEELAKARPEGPGEVFPPGVRDIVHGRIAAMSEDAQETLRVMAVCGRRVEHRLLSRVSKLPEARLIEALREMIVRCTVVDEPAGLYAFRHALVHEAVYHSVFTGERMELHGRVAQILASGRGSGDGHPADTRRAVGPEDSELAAKIAHHWYEAGEYPRALGAAIVSARITAASMYAFRDADGQYQRVLELWERVPSTARPSEVRLLDLLKEAAEVARWVGDVNRAIALVERALTLTDEVHTPAEAGMLHERLGLYRWEAGDGRRSSEAYEVAGKLLGGETISAARAWVLADQCALLMLSSRYRESAERCREGLLLARQARALAAEVHILDTLGFCEVMLGAAEEGIAKLDEARRRAEHADDVEAVCRAFTNLVTVLPLLGRHDEALKLADEGLAMMRRLGVELTAGGVLLGMTAGVLFRLGEWTRAESLTRELLDRSIPAGIAMFAHVIRVELDTGRGRLDEAQRNLELAESCARGMTDPMALANLLAAKAELRIWRCEHEAAGAAVEEGLELLDGTEEEHLAIRLCAIGLRNAAEVAGQRRGGDGDRLLARARQAFRHSTAAFPEATAHALTCEAEYARLCRRRDAKGWASVAEAWEALRFVGNAAYARLRQAEAAVSGRQSREGAQALHTARRHTAALADEPALLLRDIEGLARRAHIDLRGAVSARRQQPADVDRFRLTPREREVLTLLVEGSTNRQIASALFITEKTASVHVSNIIAKLGVASRGQAAAAAHRLRLVGGPAADGNS